MKVSEIMQSNVQYCDPDSSIVDVARKMANEECGIIPLVRDGKPIGVITDRDIATRVVAVGDDIGSIPARQVMSSRPRCASKNASIEECCGLMGEHKIRRVLVTDENGGLIGIISMADIAKNCDPNQVGHLIKLICESEEAIACMED